MQKTNYHIIISGVEPDAEFSHIEFERKGELDTWLTEHCVLPTDGDGIFNKLKDGRECIVMRGYPLQLAVKVSV